MLEHSSKGLQALVAVVVVLLTGCAAAGDTAGQEAAAPAGSQPSGAASAQAPARGAVKVLAGGSLENAWREIETAFEAQRPGVDAVLDFAQSREQADRLIAGDAADVYASTNPAQMDRVAQADRLSEPPQEFAVNPLQMVVPPGNPLDIRAPTDLGRPGLRVALTTPNVPAGEVARRVLQEAGIRPSKLIVTDDVEDVAVGISRGEADVGIAYTTNVVAAGGRVEGAAIPPLYNATVPYTIGALRAATNPDGARAFIEFVRSPEGRGVLGRFGLEPPSV